VFSKRTDWNLTRNDFSRALDAHRRSGRPLLDLTASNPTAVGLRYDPAILPALSNPAALSYNPDPKGLLTARAAVAEYYNGTEHSGCSLSPEQIILTVSTSEAYSFVFRLLCDPGDEVLVPTPSYPLFEYLADLHDVRLVPYTLFYDHGWEIEFQSLKAAITPRSRAIILVNPNNPTGSYVKAKERAQLNALCAERNLALIVDEVFRDYRLQALAEETGNGQRETGSDSFAFNREALTFTLSGVSKISGLPQMKLAWVTTSGPEKLASGALARLEIIADTFLSMNAPIQLAAPALMGERHSICEQLIARIRTNLDELDRQLATQLLCSRLEIEGGWYAILRVPANSSDEELAIMLLQKLGVLVQPGYFYDFPGDGYIVLSLITPVEEFREGLRRVLSFTFDSGVPAQ
jgi:aspartate/methionine/tyrosine aminotransferase